MEGFTAFNAVSHKNLSYWMETRPCEGTQTQGCHSVGMRDGWPKPAAWDVLSER